MKVSQLTRLINKDDEIIILNDEELDLDKVSLYRGSVKGIKRDSQLNKYHIVNISAYDGIILVFAVEPKEKGADHEQRKAD